MCIIKRGFITFFFREVLCFCLGVLVLEDGFINFFFFR